jgi:hypothetical protein
MARTNSGAQRAARPVGRGVRTRARASRAAGVRLTSTGATHRPWRGVECDLHYGQRDPALPGRAEVGRPPIRVVLADDSYLVRVALKHLFEGVESIVVVGECEDAKRAVEKHVNAIFAKLELGDPDHVSRRVKAALLYLAERDVHPGPTRR